MPSIFPNIRVFSNESALRIRWPKYWSFSFNTRQPNEKKKKSENNIKDILGYLNHDNIHIMGILKGEEREKGTEKAFEEIMAENLPNLKKETEI